MAGYTKSEYMRFLSGVGVLIMLLGGCNSETRTESFVGYVEGEYVYVAAPQSGWIVSISVQEGDLVQPGDVLFELDDDQAVLVVEEAEARANEAKARARNIETGARPPEIAQLNAQLDAAVAQMNLAQSNYERIQSLVEKALMSSSDGDRALAERDRAKAEVDAAKEAIRVAALAGRDAELAAAQATIETTVAAIGQAEWKLKQRSVSARVDGRVELLIQRPGEYVVAGSPVLSLLPPNALKIRFFLPQEDVNRVAPGSTVKIFVDGSPDPVDGTVSFIATEAEFTPPVIYSIDSRDKLVFKVEARLPSRSGLRPGVPVDVVLP